MGVNAHLYSDSYQINNWRSDKNAYYLKKRSYYNGVNRLPIEKKVQILSMLCEGSSMRSISRVADVSINTVSRLLVDAGKACATFHNEKVQA
jgi:transposase-like protein